MPVYYNIKQLTQANVKGNTGGDDSYGYSRTIKYDYSTKTLSLINYNTQSVFTVDTDNNLVIANPNADRPSSNTTYNNTNKILQMIDYSYSTDTGGGQAQHNMQSEQIRVPPESEPFSYYYYIFTTQDFVSENLVKVGYCCNSNVGKDYPIFIKFSGDSNKHMYYPGKEGMYEFQPETLKIKNEEDIEEYAEFTVEQISQIWVPTGFSFTLDFCYPS